MKHLEIQPPICIGLSTEDRLDKILSNENVWYLSVPDREELEPLSDFELNQVKELLTNSYYQLSQIENQRATENKQQKKIDASVELLNIIKQKGYKYFSYHLNSPEKADFTEIEKALRNTTKESGTFIKYDDILECYSGGHYYHGGGLTGYFTKTKKEALELQVKVRYLKKLKDKE